MGVGLHDRLESKIRTPPPDTTTDQLIFTAKVMGIYELNRYNEILNISLDGHALDQLPIQSALDMSTTQAAIFYYLCTNENRMTHTLCSALPSHTYDKYS